MMRFSDYTAAVEGALQALGVGRKNPVSLYAPAEYGISAGGKRLRPGLVLMACEAFGGTLQQAMPAAMGIEMFHNFTLVHDDVMDRSDMRRGRPTVHKKWDANTAILSGDTMLTLATQLMADVPDMLLRPVLDVFNAMALRVYEGQRYDMDFETRDDVKLSEYLDMIDGKTGALLGASAQIGAIIGGASACDAALMYEFGAKLGIAFQIQDDYLDVYGDELTFGKPIGGDIANAKKTYLLISALERGGADAEALKAALTLPAGPLRYKAVRGIFDKMKIGEDAELAVGKYSKEALKALKHTSLSEEAKDAFKTLAGKLTGRKR